MANPEPNLAGISASGHGTSIHLRDLCEFIVLSVLKLKVGSVYTMAITV